TSLLGEYLFPFKRFSHHRSVSPDSSSGIAYKGPVTVNSAQISFFSQFSYQYLLPRFTSVHTIEQTNPKLAMAAWSRGLDCSEAKARNPAPIKPQKNSDLFQKRSNSNCRALTQASYLALARSVGLSAGASIISCRLCHQSDCFLMPSRYGYQDRESESPLT